MKQTLILVIGVYLLLCSCPGKDTVGTNATTTIDAHQLDNDGLIFTDDFSTKKEEWVLSDESLIINHALEGPGTALLPFSITDGKIILQGNWVDQKKGKLCAVIFRDMEDTGYYIQEIHSDGTINLSYYYENLPEISYDPLYIGTIAGDPAGGLPIEFDPETFPTEGELTFVQKQGIDNKIIVELINDDTTRIIYQGKADEFSPALFSSAIDKEKTSPSFSGTISISSITSGVLIDCFISIPTPEKTTLPKEELIYSIALEEDILTTIFNTMLVFTGSLITFYYNGEQIFESFGNKEISGNISFYLSENIQITKVSLWDLEKKNPNVFGVVNKEGNPEKKIPVRAYQVLDIESLNISLIKTILSNDKGEYAFYLPPVTHYILEAGVTEEDYEQGKGLYGARFVDLLIPTSGPYIDINLKKK